MMTTWWAWAAAALVLGVIEMLAPGFVFLGFAIGAGVVALLLLVGGPFAVWMTGNLALLFVVFAALSLLAWIALRAVFGRPGQAPKRFEHDINE
ncbi:NfeD family protein [Pseudaestuariivita atlantica]|uniref:NfeD-like C-terminal domain-containing protein n=1 Tax=Pseudaestuariivita atlantica TaxID=1317121 RepID=A0A0L1JUR1_9RHOB|nr:hypothetical protein [Pseudaestuariivita atlantica]KNG95148.1 hypothetical protein ATO11_00395 [Pseudaestuariivita atlantica]